MIYVLFGEEHYLLNKELERIIDKHITFEKDMNTSFWDASKSSMEEIIADAQTIPFFSEKKAVVVNHANFLTANNDNAMNIEVLETYIKDPNTTTVLIFICLHAKLDARKKIVKRLQKDAKVLQYAMFNDYEKTQFIKQESKKRNVIFDQEGYKEFIFRIGYSATRIISELDKLSLYNTQIQKADVIALVTRPLDDNVFDIFQALLRHDFKRAYAYWLDFNAQNIDPIALIAMLASQYRFLQQVKILQSTGMPKNQIAQKLEAHPFRVEKTLQSCVYLNEKEISYTLHSLADLDQNIKAGRIDKKLGFEMFLIERGK